MEDATQPTRRHSTISGFPKPSKREGKDIDTGVSKRRPQLKTISTFQPPTTKKSKEGKRVKTAQMLIREDNGRGLRAPPPLQMFDGKNDSKMDVDPPSGFLKPAGVDAPTGLSNPALKRVRGTVDPTSQEEKRPKKKKKREPVL